MPKLDPEVTRSIRAICEHADMLVKMKEYSFAISKYFEALSLIPDPKREYKAATWIYTSIGETYWKLRDYHNAGAQFFNALTSVGGDQSARLNLRVGECLYECGDDTHYPEYLCKAYMLDGEHAFEEEDPKYFEAIRYEVEGAPDDDVFGSEYPMDDIYLVDSVLGDGPVPTEYLENGEPIDEDPYERYDRENYGEDEDDPIVSRDQEYGDDIIDSREQEYGGEEVDPGQYFDGEDLGYDEGMYGDDDYDESPVKRFIRWFVDLFK